MPKRIVVCSDGTWNRPERKLGEDFPTNVLRMARAIQPLADDGKPQQVFYDWGIGSYYDRAVGGATGKGIQKNIMDAYRYVVQNYSPGDEVWLFGFSRGAYTVRSLCGLINNCGILKRPDAELIEAAFRLYKKPGPVNAPSGRNSVAFRGAHAHPSREVEFVGAWDTVGALGIPISFLGFFDDEDEFYDTKLGSNVRAARHALAIDEIREDFAPSIWNRADGLDLRQVWFCGAHADVGGSQKPDRDGSRIADIPLLWMMSEARKFGLSVERYLDDEVTVNPVAKIHPSRRSFYRLKGRHFRPIEHGKSELLIHRTVKERWDREDRYRPKNLREFVEVRGWPDDLVDPYADSGSRS
jgi:uncharacterized protein (DUF2235 family)